MNNIFDVTEFGAVPDGVSDSTEAFQSAVDKAHEVKGCVVVPPGIYNCSKIIMRSGVCLLGYKGWGYRETGGTVIKYIGDSDCLIDMTGAFGACIKDIQLLGNHCKGENVHGIYVKWDNYSSRMSDDPEREDNALPEETQIGFREDSLTLDGCQIKNFSGDAVHLENIWAFTINGCMLIANKGNGIYVKGWDGWITDCIMHTNHGAAVYSDEVCASVTVNANRIEWNRNGGITLKNGSSMNITGNFFDRAYGPAISLLGEKWKCCNITVTGNIFNRSGKYKESFEENKYQNSHIYFYNCANITVTGNSFSIGRDDRDSGTYGPDYAIVYKSADYCVFSSNVMNKGAVKQLIVDLGDNENNYIEGNVGNII